MFKEFRGEIIPPHVKGKFFEKDFPDWGEMMERPVGYTTLFFE
jgi:hypothetical protein